MAEFPEHLLNTISLGDTLDWMAQLPDGCVNLIVTSPPYAVGKDYEKDERGKRLGLDHLLKLAGACFREYQRLLVPGGYVVWQFGDNTYGKQEFNTEVHTTIPMTYVYFLLAQTHAAQLELQAARIWRKNYAKLGVPFICNIEPRPLLDYEHIWTFRKRDGVGQQKVRDHRLSRRGVWDTTKEGLDEFDEPPERALPRAHGAAFPLAIPKWAITLYSDPGDVVMDNFMGTGTTAVAAVMLGRNFYGIERDPQWVEFANQRLAQLKIAGTQQRMEIA